MLLHFLSSKPSTCPGLSQHVTPQTAALRWFLKPSTVGLSPAFLFSMFLAVVPQGFPDFSESFPSSGTPDSFFFFLKRKTSQKEATFLSVFWKCCSHESQRCNLDLMYSQQQSSEQLRDEEQETLQRGSTVRVHPDFTWRQKINLLLKFF